MIKKAITKRVIMYDLESQFSGASYFSEKEISCRCGCGMKNLNPGSLKRINIAREILGRSMTLNSCVRCERHNKDIDGSPTSSHIATDTKSSFAFDIRLNNDGDRLDIVEALILAGFRRILIYKNFIHTDDDPNKSNTFNIMENR